MSLNVRLPRTERAYSKPAEDDLIIPLITGATTIPSIVAFPSNLDSWKDTPIIGASPYTQAMIEFHGDAPGSATIGDGTLAQAIGLYGALPNGLSQNVLIGMVGINLGNAMPQIPIKNQFNGFAQLINIPSIFESVAIATIGSAAAFAAGLTYSVTIRPIIAKLYGG